MASAGPSNAPAQPNQIATNDPSVSHNIVPRVTNVVVSADLGCPLDLKYINLHLRIAEYNPSRFQAVILKVHEPRCTALLFSSGRMVIMGAKSEDDARLASRKVARVLQKLGFPSTLRSFAVQNIVGSAGVSFPIRLESLAQSHGYFAQYEPEIFPGVIYRMMDPKVTILIFVSGKVVITGSKTREKMYLAFNKIYPTLLEHKKQ